MRIEDLERELHAERPEIDPEFASKLDDWAAAGFPRGGELDRRARGRAGSGFLGGAGDWLRRTRERIASVPPRRILAPLGAAATLIVVGAVAISQVDDTGTGLSDSSDSGSSAISEAAKAPGDDGGESAATVEPAAPAPNELDALDSAEVRSSAEEEAAGAAIEPAQSAAPAPPIDGDGAAGISRGTEDRLQDATARLRIGADGDKVQEVANDVVSVTDRHKGFVLDSQVTTDQAGARASFELEIPFDQLDATLTDLSELGDVISRTETAEDITNRAVRAQKDYADVRDQIADKRIELIEADSHEERLIIRSQIESLDAQADAFEAQYNDVQREARFATVSVEVTSDGPKSDDGAWGIGDALDDAGGVLETIGGVALISLAVLAPLGLIAALAYWLITLARNAGRERALDQG